MENTRDQLLDIIREYVDIPAGEIRTDQAFKTAMGVDSFIFMAMVSSIEERFGLSIYNRDLLGFKTLDDIIRYIDGHRA